MIKFLSVFGLLALVSALLLASPGTARAEFWSCDKNRDKGKVLYSYSGTPDRYSARYSHASTPAWARQAGSQPRAYQAHNQHWSGRSRW